MESITLSPEVTATVEAIASAADAEAAAKLAASLEADDTASAVAEAGKPTSKPAPESPATGKGHILKGEAGYVASWNQTGVRSPKFDALTHGNAAKLVGVYRVTSEDRDRTWGHTEAGSLVRTFAIVRLAGKLHTVGCTLATQACVGGAACKSHAHLAPASKQPHKVRNVSEATKYYAVPVEALKRAIKAPTSVASHSAALKLAAKA